MSTLITVADQDNIFQFIKQSNKIGESTKVQYIRMLKRALGAGVDFSDVDSIVGFASQLPNSGRGLFKAALKLWGKHIQTQAKLQATPDNIQGVLAVIARFEGIDESLTVKQSTGQKTHIWLSRGEVVRLYDYCTEETNRCKRDRLLLGLLVVAGLRRDELSRLCFKHLMKQPHGDKTRWVLDIDGKGKKKRTVPITDVLVESIQAWREDVVSWLFEQARQIDDLPIIRSVNKGDNIGAKEMSGHAISKIVKQAGASIGRPELSPHDLRRTYARIAYDNGIPIGQISLLLGHESIKTTERYINIELKLGQSACDFIPFVPIGESLDECDSTMPEDSLPAIISETN